MNTDFDSCPECNRQSSVVSHIHNNTCNSLLLRKNNIDPPNHKSVVKRGDCTARSRHVYKKTSMVFSPNLQEPQSDCIKTAVHSRKARGADVPLLRPWHSACVAKCAEFMKLGKFKKLYTTDTAVNHVPCRKSLLQKIAVRWKRCLICHREHKVIAKILCQELCHKISMVH